MTKNIFIFVSYISILSASSRDLNQRFHKSCRRRVSCCNFVDGTEGRKRLKLSSVLLTKNTWYELMHILISKPFRVKTFGNIRSDPSTDGRFLSIKI